MTHYCPGRCGQFVWLAPMVLALLFGAGTAIARTIDDGGEDEAKPVELEATRIAGPFEFPWSIAFLPDNSILVTERPGRLTIVRADTTTRELSGLPPILKKSGGLLLDVAVDPDFARNGTIYLSYLASVDELSAVYVLRAKLDRKTNALVDQRVIFESTFAESTEQYGGRLAVTEDGYLFLTHGDRWEPARAQDISGNIGAIIRIRTDGTVPADNPFFTVERARPEIWSYGHRNPQGLALDSRTGQLWSHEHGPMGGDELNLILPGRNYGWPIITHGIGYDGRPVGEGDSKEGMETPFYPFIEAIAPSGLALENAGPVMVLWVGTLAGQSLFRIELEGGKVVSEQRLLKDQLGRIRDVRIGPDGLLYVITDDPEGALYRLDPPLEQAEKARNKSRL